MSQSLASCFSIYTFNLNAAFLCLFKVLTDQIQNVKKDGSNNFTIAPGKKIKVVGFNSAACISICLKEGLGY